MFHQSRLFERNVNARSHKISQCRNNQLIGQCIIFSSSLVLILAAPAHPKSKHYRLLRPISHSLLSHSLSLSPFSLSLLSPTHLQGAPHIKTHVHDIGWWKIYLSLSHKDTLPLSLSLSPSLHPRPSLSHTCGCWQKMSKPTELYLNSTKPSTCLSPRLSFSALKSVHFMLCYSLQPGFVNRKCKAAYFTPILKSCCSCILAKTEPCMKKLLHPHKLSTSSEKVTATRNFLCFISNPDIEHVA